LDNKVANGVYDAGEDFINPNMADLNLYLMKAGETDVSKNIWSSESSLYNVQHIFFNLPAQDQGYELWVEQKSPGAADYALAWWTEAGSDPKKKIEGMEWKEDVVDGLRSYTEGLLGGVRVDLHDAVTDAIVDTRWTDSTGDYSFQSVDPGSYYVTFHAPYGYDFTFPNQGTDDTIDSDASPDANDPSVGRTDIIDVADSDVSNVDAGFVKLDYESIGDRVWQDTNGDGIQDDPAAEPGLADVQTCPPPTGRMWPPSGPATTGATSSPT
jgi:hypothetical protein